MEKKNANYSLFTLFLDSAKTSTLFARKGEIIQIVDASNPSATISIKLNDEDGPLIRVRLGDIVALPFDRFWIANSAQANQWVKILISPDIQNRFWFSDYVTSFDGLPRLIANVSVTDSLSSVITPSKECSKFVLVNDSDSDGVVFVGDASLAPDGSYLGDVILPTKRKEFRGVNTSFKIYARCKSGETATLGVVEYD